MSAAMPHLMKYTKAYDDLYPSATQILVQSGPSYFFGSDSSAVRDSFVQRKVAKLRIEGEYDTPCRSLRGDGVHRTRKVWRNYRKGALTNTDTLLLQRYAWLSFFFSEFTKILSS